MFRSKVNATLRGVTLEVDTSTTSILEYTKRLRKVKWQLSVEHLKLRKLTDNAGTETDFYDFLSAMFKLKRVKTVLIEREFLNGLSISQCVALFDIIKEYDDLVEIKFHSSDDEMWQLSVKVLAIALEQIPTLPELKLDNVHLKGSIEDYNTIQDALMNHDALERFELEDSFIQSRRMHYLIHGLSHTPTLIGVTLAFKETPSTDRMDLMISKLFDTSEKSSIVNADADSSEFVTGDKRAIIEELKIGRLHISKECVTILAELLAEKSNTSLRKLSLNHCNISKDTGAMEMANMLSSNTSLHVLELQDNDLNNEFCIQASIAIGNRVSNFLQHLKIDRNPKITEEGREAISKAFEKHKTITKDSDQAQKEWDEKNKFEHLLHFGEENIGTSIRNIRKSFVQGEL